MVITSAFDSGDGVFIGGKHLHNTFKPMTNIELTLDQLTALAGGVQMGPNGETCTDRFTWKDIQDIFGGGKGIVHPEFRLSGSEGPGGTSF
ncbi:CCRG-2 family RiPP [Synechococcus sp. ROS8604]|uniref:CCRG-2 family RiPP n=1 Tax=Synechococcus sp. ROS8604 TaxID=1442557 RepID=UPI00164884A5|nr:CCRG-2 family RiPP [Synechococcus sp. ROS8604]